MPDLCPVLRAAAARSRPRPDARLRQILARTQAGIRPRCADPPRLNPCDRVLLDTLAGARGPLTAAGLASRTGYAAGTVRMRLMILTRRGLVDGMRGDGRQPYLYRPAVGGRTP